MSKVEVFAEDCPLPSFIHGGLPYLLIGNRFTPYTDIRGNKELVYEVSTLCSCTNII